MDQMLGCRPMAIDLETFQVSVYPARMAGGIGDDQPLCCVDGRILCYAT